MYNAFFNDFLNVYFLDYFCKIRLQKKRTKLVPADNNYSKYRMHQKVDQYRFFGGKISFIHFFVHF